LIATVDKFAALPWTGPTGSLFGLVERYDEQGFYGPSNYNVQPIASAICLQNPRSE
jgi:hypothetical protein